MAKYKQYRVKSSSDWTEWIYPVRRKPYKLACCDCGLVHNVEFQVIEQIKSLGAGRFIAKNKPPAKMRTAFRVQRNNRATAAMRRKKK